jgi:hypothetical protein
MDDDEFLLLPVRLPPFVLDYLCLFTFTLRISLLLCLPFYSVTKLYPMGVMKSRHVVLNSEGRNELFSIVPRTCADRKANER